MKYVDGGVLVVRSMVTQKEHAEMAMDMLQNVKNKLIGVVFNNMDVSRGRYYGNYYYYE